VACKEERVKEESKKPRAITWLAFPFTLYSANGATSQATQWPTLLFQRLLEATHSAEADGAPTFYAAAGLYRPQVGHFLTNLCTEEY
jgi:hypothetical protein